MPVFFTIKDYMAKFDIKVDFIGIMDRNLEKKTEHFRKAGYKKISYSTSTDDKKTLDKVWLSKYF